MAGGALPGPRRPRRRRRARCPPTSRSCTCRWTTSPARFADGVRGAHGDARAAATPGALADDPAIARVRRAADPGAERGRWASPRCAAPRASAPGSSSTRSSTPDRCRELIDAYREAGGTAVVRSSSGGRGSASRRVSSVDAAGRRLPQLLVARGRARTGAATRCVGEPDADAVVERLVDALARRPGADALNLRVHVPGRHARRRRASRSCGSATRCCPACARSLHVGRSDRRRR